MVDINPHAIYVYCDGGMEYNSKSTGGIGFYIKFPDFVDIVDIKRSVGRYEGANIERLELEAIIQGMNELLLVFNLHEQEFRNVNTVIFITDRYHLNDTQKTSPYRIKEYRSNGWENDEEKEVKNRDLLDKLDKTRTKIRNKLRCSLSIKYERRKHNKVADKLAEEGKQKKQVNKSIQKLGQKIGRRIYDGDEIKYENLSDKESIVIHIFKKEPIDKQWEISAELCEGRFLGKKLKIYTDFKLEKKLQRHHTYKIRIKKRFRYHISIYRTFKEIKKV